MKWMGRRQSSNVEDRRNFSGGGKFAVGGGIVGVIFLIVRFLLTGDGGQLMDDAGQMSSQAQVENTINPQQDEEMASYIKVALADNEDVWNRLFKEQGLEYREPVLVLFRNATTSGCGDASSATGPFYCPSDEKIYIDLSFFDELKQRFGAQGGDFAVSYVLAHEVGHHVQNLLGTSQKVANEQNGSSEKYANKLSVALELQADFYAGVWTYNNQKYKGVLEQGDIEEALSAANAVGDDRIQKRSQGYAVPDAFTHGTSEQRMYWFNRGFKSGDLSQGDTFSGLK